MNGIQTHMNTDVYNEWNLLIKTILVFFTCIHNILAAKSKNCTIFLFYIEQFQRVL